MEEPGAALVPLDHADVLVDLDLDPVGSPPSYNPAIVYLSGLSPNSKRAMRAALNRVAGELVGWVGKGRDRRPRVGFDEIPGSSSASSMCPRSVLGSGSATAPARPTRALSRSAKS
jgi:hypothetical protein